jgi:opacity protein-like surface antigen
MMKRSCVAGAVLTCVLAGSAMAADMPLKAPVPVISDWIGFYIGIHGGYGWARPGISDLDLNQGYGRDLFFHAPKLRGAVFGGHAGYNWQWGHRGVVGLEIDYSAANIKSTQGAIGDLSVCCQTVETRVLQSKLDSLASARARAGFLIGSELLLYGTGGAAWANTKFTDTYVSVATNMGPSNTLVAVSRASTNHFGWVAGAGAEWKLWQTGMILRVEYLHYDFGSASLAFHKNGSSDDCGCSFTDNFNIPLERLTTDVVRGGLSYKF